MLDESISPTQSLLPEPCIGNLDAVRDLLIRVVRTKHGRDQIAQYVLHQVRSDFG
jgi:hypothetical protein